MKNIAGLSAVGLLCWIVMFLAGTDVWHFAGSPDFWRLSGPPYADLRAFSIAFYVQFMVLTVLVGLAVRSAVRARREREGVAPGTPAGP